MGSRRCREDVKLFVGSLKKDAFGDFPSRHNESETRIL